MDAVFCVDDLGNPVDAVSGICPDTIDLGFLAGNIGGFAQAADDTRAVIDFMHNWPVPGDFPTPVPCTDSGETSYDVSISDVSGLQVPVRMVAGTEGREFTLTVTNEGASPDAATGAVLLTAIDAIGNPIPTFPRAYTFTLLAPGTSTSWTEGFSINYATTITWTATVTATFDVNPSNNSVTETTEVIGTGGDGTLDVANVVGLTEAAARAVLDPQLVVVVNTANSDTVAAGLVISQNPTACTLCADPGDTVTLTISLGTVADLSDVSITSVQIPLNLARSGIVKTLSVTVRNDATAAGAGTGTVTLSGTDGSVFTDTFTNLAPGLSHTSSWNWTVPSSQTVVWTIEVTVDGVVVDSATRQTVIR
jgi:energy-converting hydrogenase Eha subunit B